MEHAKIVTFIFLLILAKALPGWAFEEPASSHTDWPNVDFTATNKGVTQTDSPNTQQTNKPSPYRICAAPILPVIFLVLFVALRRGRKRNNFWEGDKGCNGYFKIIYGQGNFGRGRGKW